MDSRLKSIQNKLTSSSGKALCFILGIVYSLAFITPLSPTQVRAADPNNFSFFAGSKAEQKRSVADAWNKGGGDEYDEAGWKVMRVYAKDLESMGPAALQFNATLTKEMACSGAIAGGGSISPVGGCESREPIFTITYYCTVSSKSKSYQKPASNVEHYEFVYAVGLKNNGNNGDEFVSRNDYNSTGGPVLVKKFEATSNGYTREVVTRDLTEHRKSPDDLGKAREGNKNGREDNDWGVDNQDDGCRPGRGITGDMTVKSFDKLPAAQKREFDPEDTASRVSADGSGGDVDPQADCDAKASSPLSWIICPIVDLGANLSDFIFRDIVSPLLKDVPVSTDRNDPSYKVWEQFRIIANILLIGTLLAIVYSQARGDR